MAHFGSFVLMNPLASGTGGAGAGTNVLVPGNAAAVVARAAGMDFDVELVDADNVLLILPENSTADGIQTIAQQILYVFGVPATNDLGWLTVTAKGLLALADSSDAGGAPDYIPVVGTVVLTPSITRPVRILSSGRFLALNPLTTTFDSDGELAYDGIKNVRIVAPQWTDLSNTSWRWNVEVKPGPGQSWQGFTGSFTGAPGSTFNLVSLL